MNNLRAKLKQGTSVAHARLDTALIEYDLTSRRGLKAYLRVHHAARTQLGQISLDSSVMIDNAQRLAELEDDLFILGAQPISIDFQRTAQIHPVGLSYVIAGSSLGSKLLYKSWSQSNDPLVKLAGKFLTSSKESTDWITFLSYVDSIVLSEDEVAEVIMSANTVFTVFEEANNKIRLSADD